MGCVSTSPSTLSLPTTAASSKIMVSRCRRIRPTTSYRCTRDPSLALRESTFSLDGVMEHDTELAPQVCYTDIHGYSEVVMATAAPLGFDLSPRIRDAKDQALYKMNRTKKYPLLDLLLTGTIRSECIRQSWDELARVIASI